MQADIENKCERAVVYHLNQSAALLSGVTILTGVNPGALEVPCIIASVSGSEENPTFSGNYMVDMDILVRSNADDETRETHNTRVGVVREQLMAEWAGTSLSGHLTNFTALAVVAGRNATKMVDRSWETTVGIRLPCRPSD